GAEEAGVEGLREEWGEVTECEKVKGGEVMGERVEGVNEGEWGGVGMVEGMRKMGGWRKRRGMGGRVRERRKKGWGLEER
ncbi:hypothetical protein, partial [Micrococcus luteus]|uniref:hypothetical protein n=1 Tax=Micrococcus luteus TaxID=1270 RepID=UPI0016432598